MLIRDYSSRKVCDYLDTGKYRRVLLIFRHGLGDSIMFYSTCYKALIAKYPNISFTYSTHCGQEEVFGKVDTNPDHYDIAFEFAYPCSEWGQINETKSEKCARVEIGLHGPLKEDYSVPGSYPTPLVGVHFNSTSCPSLDASKEVARRLWNQILESGLIPIDTHMRHMYDNKRSVVHDFEQSRRVDNVQASVPNLIGLIGSLRGFAGVPSGNLVCAMAVLPARKILFMSSDYPMDRITRLDCFEMNLRKPYDAVLVGEWLDTIKRS